MNEQKIRELEGRLIASGALLPSSTPIGTTEQALPVKPKPVSGAPDLPSSPPIGKTGQTLPVKPKPASVVPETPETSLKESPEEMSSPVPETGDITETPAEHAGTEDKPERDAPSPIQRAAGFARRENKKSPIAQTMLQRRMPRVSKSERKVPLNIDLEKATAIAQEAKNLGNSLPMSDSIHGGYLIFAKAAEALAVMSRCLDSLCAASNAAKSLITPHDLNALQYAAGLLSTSAGASQEMIKNVSLHSSHAAIKKFYETLPDGLKADALKKLENLNAVFLE